MRKILVLFFIYAQPLWAYDPMYADYAKTIGQDVFNLYLDLNHFNTTANLDGEGSKTALPEGDSFTKTDLDLIIKYGILKELDLSMGFRFRSNDSVQGEVNKTTYGEESFSLNTRWNFLKGKKFNLALDLFLSWTFYKNTEAQKNLNQLILGDPGSSIGISLLGGYELNHFLGLNAILGVNWPPNNLSSELLYDLRLNIRVGDFLFVAGFDGIISFNTDAFGSFEEKMGHHGFNTGGSNLFYSYNRGLFAPYASVSSLMWDVFRVQFRASRYLSGNSIDEGTKVGLNFLYNFGSGTVVVKKREKLPKGEMVEGQIMDFTPQNKFAKLNLGTSKGVEKGMKVIFYRRTKIEDVPLARGVIYDGGVNWSIAKVEKYFKSESLKKGQVVKVLVDQ